MTLEPAGDPDRLYAAAHDDVNPRRPLFTGDVFADAPSPGSMCIVLSHPCSFRGAEGALAPQILIAPVEPTINTNSEWWATHDFKRFPLAGLGPGGQWLAARFDLLNTVETAVVTSGTRIACLDHPGINLLQQRLVHHLTRTVVDTDAFQRAFAHTYEEADLLESWSTELAGVDPAPEASFEAWIREGEPSRQNRLRLPEERAPIRRAMRSEIKARLDMLGGTVF